MVVTVNINSNSQHVAACQWLTICIILHNLVIEVESGQHSAYFTLQHGRVEEEDNRALHDEPQERETPDGEAKHQKLVEELFAFQNM